MMSRIQFAIFPGFLAGCTCVIITSIFLSPQKIAHASYQEEVVVSDFSAGEITATSGDGLVNPQINDVYPHTSESCTSMGGIPDEVKQWCDLIEQHAIQNNLDPILVAAIVMQESRGNPQAYSQSGAVGLMQIMPRDGIAASYYCMNGPCFFDRPSMAELFVPSFNIRYGCELLASLISRVGNLRDALRAYGPAGVGYSYADHILLLSDTYR